jgi:hypothetical protein
MTEDLPRTIENSVTGERVTFLATAEETNGEYIRIRNETSAGAPGVVMHYHLAYTEAFEVLEGSLDVCVGTKENHPVLAEGESAFVLEAQLPRGVMVGEQQRSERARCQDLRNRYFARVAPWADVQGLLPHLPHFPAARDRKARALGLATRLVGDVVARAEQVGDLVVPVGHHRLLKAMMSGWSSRRPSTRTDLRSSHAPCRPHRLSVATRTSRVPDTLSIANLPSRSPPREHAA